MVKESRLSFRVPDTISNKIDLAVLMHNHITDRSEFGSMAIKFFLEYLYVTSPEVEVYAKLIFKIAESGKIKTDEINELQELMESYN